MALYLILKTIAEWFSVKKAFHGCGKVWLMDRETTTDFNGETKQKVAIGGVVVGDLRSGEPNTIEMWEGHIIFIPLRRCINPEYTELNKMTMQGLMTSKETYDPENYSEIIDNKA